MGKQDDKLKELMKALADTIGQIFSGNEEIRQTLSMIEKEGYHVDLILASVTRVSRKGNEDQLPDTEIEISDFDRSFMKKIHLRFGEED